MNRIILLVIFLVGSHICYSQNDNLKINTFGIGLNTVYNGNFGFYPQLSFSKNIFSFKAGPIFSKSELQTGYTSFLDEMRLYGGGLSCQFYPNCSSNYFDLYFVVNTSYYNFKKEIVDPQPTIEDVQKTAFRPTIGYGFNFKPFSNLYITSCFVYGASFEKVVYENDILIKKKHGYAEIIIGLQINIEKNK